jgi:hypothetical protein
VIFQNAIRWPFAFCYTRRRDYVENIMSDLIYAHQISDLQQQCILHWIENPNIQLQQTDFLLLVEENHAFNYQLWHAEDKARREDKGFEFVYRAKREIDHFNQQRNNRMEAMDEYLFLHLHAAAAKEAVVHSETPGMMIDRLSILALKSHFMHQQVKRQDVDEAHQQACLSKFKTINEQRQQLQICLHELFQGIISKTRTFRLYHQFKMYNDPKLNPELYTPR